MTIQNYSDLSIANSNYHFKLIKDKRSININNGAMIVKNENLLKPSEAAKMIGVSPNTFELMQAKNQTPPPVLVGKRRFWHKGILKAWIKAGFQAKD